MTNCEPLDWKTTRTVLCRLCDGLNEVVQLIESADTNQELDPDDRQVGELLDGIHAKFVILVGAFRSYRRLRRGLGSPLPIGELSESMRELASHCLPQAESLSEVMVATPFSELVKAEPIADILTEICAAASQAPSDEADQHGR